MRSPMDDYREFFEFDMRFCEEDLVSKSSKVVGHLSKRLGPGSGGASSPVICHCGAALASCLSPRPAGQEGRPAPPCCWTRFNKMDMTNIIATMRYLEELGLQVSWPAPGENLGTLTAFLHRYYDILETPDNNAIFGGART